MVRSAVRPRRWVERHLTLESHGTAPLARGVVSPGARANTPEQVLGIHVAAAVAANHRRIKGASRSQPAVAALPPSQSQLRARPIPSMRCFSRSLDAMPSHCSTQSSVGVAAAHHALLAALSIRVALGARQLGVLIAGVAVHRGNEGPAAARRTGSNARAACCSANQAGRGAQTPLH